MIVRIGSDEMKLRISAVQSKLCRPGTSDVT
jgi:hypothetical protein